jgi:hypothetical protein
MWTTPIGVRALTGPEAKLFKKMTQEYIHVLIDMASERVEGVNPPPAMNTQETRWDDLPWFQQICGLGVIQSHLLNKSASPPVAAWAEITIEAIYAFLGSADEKSDGFYGLVNAAAKSAGIPPFAIHKGKGSAAAREKTARGYVDTVAALLRRIVPDRDFEIKDNILEISGTTLKAMGLREDFFITPFPAFSGRLFISSLIESDRVKEACLLLPEVIQRRMSDGLDYPGGAEADTEWPTRVLEE